MSRRVVSVRLLCPLLDYLRERDVDVARLAGSVGLDAPLLQELDSYIDGSRAVSFFDVAAQKLKDPLLGLHVGATVTRESFDLLSQATAVSGTLREMGERFSRFAAIAAPGPIYSLREEADRAWWILTHAFGARRCARHFCELSVSLGIHYTRERSNGTALPIRVHFDHASAASPHEYELALGTEVLFSQHESGFVIARKWLDLPLPSADPGLAKVLDRYAEEVVGRTPKVDDLVGRVSVHIARALAHGSVVDLTQLAKALAMSARSLQRHLSARGTSVQVLLDQERQKQALRLLQQDGASIDSAAERLGFSDVAAFRRAFKRWTGTTPGAYLRRR